MESMWLRWMKTGTEHRDRMARFMLEPAMPSRPRRTLKGYTPRTDKCDFTNRTNGEPVTLASASRMEWRRTSGTLKAVGVNCSLVTQRKDSALKSFTCLTSHRRIHRSTSGETTRPSVLTSIMFSARAHGRHFSMMFNVFAMSSTFAGRADRAKRTLSDAEERRRVCTVDLGRGRR